jgi:hypothetical protein
MEQDIRFCKTSDGVRIAFASVGQGPPLIRALGWATHQYSGRVLAPLRSTLAQHHCSSATIPHRRLSDRDLKCTR